MKDFYISTEKEREYKRKYYERNREKVKQRNKEYREKNAEKIRDYQKRYGMTHDRTEYYRQYNLKRKQRKIAESAEQ